MMVNNLQDEEPDLSDLFSDDSLYSAFRAAPSFLSNKFNLVCVILVSLSLAFFSLVRISSLPNGPSIDFYATFNSWATIGWTLAGILLGFLIAGFALLITILRPSAIVHLHSLFMEGAKTNLLRELFLFFAEIFVQVLSFLFFCIAVALLGTKGGPLTEIKSLVVQVNPNAFHALGYVLYAIWATWFVVLLLKVKSFIYNLYQSLLFGMAHSVHFEE